MTERLIKEEYKAQGRIWAGVPQESIKKSSIRESMQKLYRNSWHWRI
jgi:hypothetical protein